MLRDTIPNRGGSSSYLYEDDILYYLDSSRNKWLSIFKQTLFFGLDDYDMSLSRYMKMVGGVYSNLSGYKLLRHIDITGISIDCKEDTTCSFIIRKDNEEDSLYTLSLTNESSKTVGNLDIEVEVGSIIQLYMSTTNPVSFPEVIIEYSWLRELTPPIPPTPSNIQNYDNWRDGWPINIPITSINYDTFRDGQVWSFE